jgi:hypothetical protein
MAIVGFATREHMAALRRLARYGKQLGARFGLAMLGDKDEKTCRGRVLG